VGSSQFAAYLFAGLTAFNALADVLARAPSVLTERRDLLLNSPLLPAVLPLLPVGSSLVLELLSVGLLLLWLGVRGQFQPQALLFYPPFLLVRLLLSLASAYGLAVLGVFLRDLRQMMPPLLTVMLMVSPILYPLDIVPGNLQPWFAWNPLAQLVQGYRAALLEGVLLWQPLLALLVFSAIALAGALWLFQRLMPQARYVL
jgi:lipopolysaccharide transport system permease protein